MHSVTWSDTVRFIRQLSHDLRNDLNAIELQSAYISELEASDEVRSEIKRLRELTSGLATTLQRLSGAVGEIVPSLISYQAADLMEDLRTKIEHDFPTESAAIRWESQPGGATLQVDPQLLQEAFTELFANAFRHGRGQGQLLATAKIDNSRFVFTLHEPKADSEIATANWGREPLRKITARHYALGLQRARAIIEAHGGELHARYDPNASALITTLTLSSAGKSSKQA